MNISKNISRSISSEITNNLSSNVLSYLAKFFTADNEWIDNTLKDITSGFSLVPVDRGCLQGNSAGYLNVLGFIYESKYFRISLNINPISVGGLYSYLFGFGGGSGVASVSISASDTLIRSVSYNDANEGDFTTNAFAPVLGVNNIIEYEIDASVDNNITQKIWHNGVLIYNEVRTGTFTFINPKLLLGSRVNASSPVAAHKFNDIVLQNSVGVDKHYFPLDNYIAGSTPSVVEFPDIIGGATAALVNGAPATNLSSRTDASRSNNLLGFRFDAANSYYSPADPNNSGFDIEGLPLTNPAINGGKGYNGCEQRYKAQEGNAELIAIDVDNIFYDVGGNPIDFDPSIIEAPYVVKTQDGSNVSKMIIKK